MRGENGLVQPLPCPAQPRPARPARPANLLSNDLCQQARLAGNCCHGPQAPSRRLQHWALLQVNLHVGPQLRDRQRRRPAGVSNRGGFGGKPGWAGAATTRQLGSRSAQLGIPARRCSRPPQRTCSRGTAALRSEAGEGSRPASSSACRTVTPAASVLASMPARGGQQGRCGVEAAQRDAAKLRQQWRGDAGFLPLQPTAAHPRPSCRQRRGCQERCSGTCGGQGWGSVGVRQTAARASSSQAEVIVRLGKGRALSALGMEHPAAGIRKRTESKPSPDALLIRKGHQVDGSS